MTDSDENIQAILDEPLSEDAQAICVSLAKRARDDMDAIGLKLPTGMTDVVAVLALTWVARGYRAGVAVQRLAHDLKAERKATEAP